MWLQPMTGHWAFLVAEVLRWHIQLCLYRIVPVGYRVQILEEEYRTTWGQRLMVLPVALAGTGSNQHCLDCCLGLQPAHKVEGGSEFYQQSRSPLCGTGVDCPSPAGPWELCTWGTCRWDPRENGAAANPVGWAFPKPIPCLGQHLQHCQLPKSSWLEEEGTLSDLSQSSEARQAGPL